MSRRPLGEAAMSVAERSRRKREKAKAQAAANGKQAAVAPRGKSDSAVVFVQPPAAVDLLAGGPEAIAARILERVPIEMARDIAMALQQRLLQGGCWPMWRLPLM